MISWQIQCNATNVIRQLKHVFPVMDSLYHAVFIYTSAQVEILVEMIKMIKIPEDMKICAEANELVNGVFRKCTVEIQCLIGL